MRLVPLSTLNVFSNPIVVKCARERLRLKNLLSWGMVSVILAGFIYLICWNAAQRVLMDAAYSRGFRPPRGIDSFPEHAKTAAKLALAALILMQGIVLLLLGTGSVAIGIAQERMNRVLDYQRMTPMSPLSKIIGYLIGLPIREYYMVALTMPIVIYAAIQAEVKFANLIQLYLVGFVSVWLYHMTGMVAGMVSPKPWRAGVATQGMVVLMYFIMPQLANLGFTFFLYLTPRPVFAKLAYDELELNNWRGIVDPGDLQDSVHFFDMDIHPTVFTLIVQGFLLISMFVIVHRKWREDAQHPFSKLYALIFFAVAQVLLLGSLWPWLTQTAALRSRTTNTLFDMVDRNGGNAGVIVVLLFVFFFVSLAVILLMMNMITPSRYTYAKGIRRAKKRGLRRVPWLSDGASAMPYAVAFVALTCVSYFVLLGLARNSEWFHRIEPTAGSVAMLAIWFASLVFYIQAVRQLWGPRGFFMVLFLVWLVPFLTYVLIQAAKGEPLTAAYVSTPMPVMALGFAVGNLFTPWISEMQGDGVFSNVDKLTLCATVINILLAIVTMVILWQRQGQTKATELARFQPPPPGMAGDMNVELRLE